MSCGADTVSRMKWKLFEMFLHLVLVFGMTTSSAPRRKASLHFVRRGGEDHDVRAEGVREFHAHVAETAESHDADLLAFAHLVMTQRRIGRDAGAEQGSRGGQIQMLRHVQREAPHPRRRCRNSRRR